MGYNNTKNLKNILELFKKKSRYKSGVLLIKKMPQNKKMAQSNQRINQLIKQSIIHSINQLLDKKISSSKKAFSYTPYSHTVF